MDVTVGRSPKGSGSRLSDRAAAGVSPVPASIPNASAVYARAAEIAKERYPEGAGATILANIVREAARELGLTQKRTSGPRPPNPNEGRHTDLGLLPPEQQVEARRICSETTAKNFPHLAPCTDKGFACYRCQDLAAQAIEARRAETGTGSVADESAVAASDAPESGDAHA